MVQLNPQAHGSYLDATVGGAGHTVALLEAGAAQVVALDQDPAALQAAQARVAEWQSEQTDPAQARQVRFHHLNFAGFRLKEHGLRDSEGAPILFEGILADLGVSSPQLDQPQRGFSFRHEGPLDMRMDPTSEGQTAADLVNHADPTTLVELFSRYGEEHYAKRIVRQIVQQRPFHTTTELAEVIVRSVPPAARHGRIHPATRVFQALRIAVNQELQVLETFLTQAPDWLKPGGRLAVISFHSLEDRVVKWQFRRDPRLQVVTPKPIQASENELALNPRSRSAKLRVAQAVTPASVMPNVVMNSVVEDPDSWL